MHKVFISHHHDNDENYKDALAKYATKHSIFIDASVNTGDIPDRGDQYIRGKIRDEYLSDSTVTIVLVGTETMNRKHMDWEIYSSMYDGTVNKKSGIIVIMLPETKASFTYTSHGQEERNLYTNKSWITVDSREEYEYKYPYMPVRLIDNMLNDSAKISVVLWGDLNVNILKNLVELAFKDRAECDYDLHRPMMR